MNDPYSRSGSFFVVLAILNFNYTQNDGQSLFARASVDGLYKMLGHRLAGSCVSDFMNT